MAFKNQDNDLKVKSYCKRKCNFSIQFKKYDKI